jgi:hypothetical protein
MTSEHPAGSVNEFTKNGITYAFNLPATSELVVELEPLTRGASNTNYYPGGFKDGRVPHPHCFCEGAGFDRLPTARVNEFETSGHGI